MEEMPLLTNNLSFWENIRKTLQIGNEAEKDFNGLV